MNFFECSSGYKMQCNVKISPWLSTVLTSLWQFKCFLPILICEKTVILLLVSVLLSALWTESEKCPSILSSGDEWTHPCCDDLDREVRSSWTMWRMWPWGWPGVMCPLTPCLTVSPPHQPVILVSSHSNAAAMSTSSELRKYFTDWASWSNY